MAEAKSVEEPRKTPVERIHKDAEGQYAGTQHGGDNDGVASAKPTVITGSQDATVHKWPPGTKNPPPDWDLNFDPGDKSRGG